MRKNVFTPTDLDNIDLHKRSNLPMDKFHGTLITVTNHLSCENLGEPKANISFTDLNIVSKPELPASYSVVPPAELNVNADVLLKRTDDPVRHDRISGAVVKDCAWILKASELIAQDELKSGDIVTWAGFNSSLLPDKVWSQMPTLAFCLFSQTRPLLLQCSNTPCFLAKQ